MLRTLALLSLVAACSAEDRRSAPPAAVEPVVAPLAKATQADLAQDIDDAEKRGTWGDVKKKWRKQPLTWKVTRREALCRSEEACNVSAFAVEQGAKQGWMPRLTFAAGQFEKLAAACKGQETCEVTIAGRLEKLELNADDPVNVTLADVRLEGAGNVQTARL
jgi:hypothetical protein